MPEISFPGVIDPYYMNDFAQTMLIAYNYSEKYFG